MRSWPWLTSLLVHVFCAQASATPLRVLSLNIWINAQAVPNGLQKTLYQIQRANADVVFLQETDGAAFLLAQQLGFYVVKVDRNDSAILSRFPFREMRAGPTAIMGTVEVAGQLVQLVSLHLPAYPYSPYLACYSDMSDEQILAEEQRVRGQALMADLEMLKLNGDWATILGGDFNAPSHLDWTPETADRHCGRSLPFSATQILTDLGFRDTYRELHPNPSLDPGLTWSPVVKKTPEGLIEPQDRIDMIHIRGSNLQVQQSDVWLDRLDLWPSDHAGVLSEISLLNPAF